LGDGARIRLKDDLQERPKGTEKKKRNAELRDWVPNPEELRRILKDRWRSGGGKRIIKLPVGQKNRAFTRVNERGRPEKTRSRKEDRVRGKRE